jgi:hypothetical protein
MKRISELAYLNEEFIRVQEEYEVRLLQERLLLKHIKSSES